MALFKLKLTCYNNKMEGKASTHAMNENQQKLACHILGLPRYNSAKQPLCLFELIDAAGHAAQQLVITESTTAADRQLLQQLFSAQYLDMVDCSHDKLNRAFIDKKMWVWDFQSSKNRKIHFGLASDVPLGQQLLINSTKSRIVCMPSLDQWHNSSTAKKRYWQDFQRIFCT